MNRLLLRLAWRLARRRPTEAALVVLGCLLGTAIVTGSLLVGDSIEASMRDRVPTRLGPVDVVVRSYSPAIADAIAADFRYQPVAQADGSLAVFSAEATLAAGERVLPAVTLFELDFDAARAFGDAGATGLAGPTPSPGEVVLSADAAAALAVAAGDRVDVVAYGQQRTTTVARVLERAGVAGFAESFEAQAHNVFVAPGAIHELAWTTPMPERARPPEYLQLFSAHGGMLDGAEHAPALEAELRRRLSHLEGFEVTPLKTDLLRIAGEDAAAARELFGSLAAFAVLAGLALLVNALLVLAAERRRELGVLRAVGLRGRDLVVMAALEGCGYALVAALLGALAGIGVAAGIVTFAGEVLAGAQRGGLELRFAVQASTVAIGALSGLVAGVVTVIASSLHLARLSIVDALRDQAATRVAPRRHWRTPLAAGTLLLLAGGAAVRSGADLAGLGLPPAAVACLTVAARRHLAVRARRAVTLGGAAAAGLWGIAGFALLDVDGADIGAFVVQGVVLTVAAVVAAGECQERLLAAARRLPGRVGLVLRLGLAHPAAQRLRTGSILLAYALIVFTLVFSMALSALFSSQVERLVAAEGGGAEILLETGAGAPVPAADIAAADGIAGLASLDWAVPRFRVVGASDGTGIPQDWALSGFGPDLLAQGPPGLEEYDRSAYGDELSVWRAILRDPNLAAIDVAFLQRGGGPPERGAEIGDELEIRDPVSGRISRRRVVAVTSAGASFSGVMVSADSFAQMVLRPAGHRHYVRVQAGRDPAQVAAALERTFLLDGVRARTFQGVVGDALHSQEQFFDLIEAYLAAGLLVGIAGLGVVAVHAVRDRRRSSAVLQAIGLLPGTVRAALLVESGLIALQGVGLGAVLALVTCYQMAVGSDAFGDVVVTFAVPWGEVAMLVGATLAASLAVALPAALRSTAAPVAGALRTAD